MKKILFKFDFVKSLSKKNYIYIKREIETDISQVKDITKTNPKVSLFRVRKSWKDAKSQQGAFRIFNNAKRYADKNKGYFVFNE